MLQRPCDKPRILRTAAPCAYDRVLHWQTCLWYVEPKTLLCNVRVVDTMTDCTALLHRRTSRAIHRFKGRSCMCLVEKLPMATSAAPWKFNVCNAVRITQQWLVLASCGSRGTSHNISSCCCCIPCWTMAACCPNTIQHHVPRAMLNSCCQHHAGLWFMFCTSSSKLIFFVSQVSPRACRFSVGRVLSVEHFVSNPSIGV